MNQSPVRVEKSPDGQIWTIIITRPESKNAVDGPTAVALSKAFLDFDRDGISLVAVLCGEGGTFCSGADLKAMDGKSDNMNLLVDPQQNASSDTDAPMGPTRLLLSKPVIAAIAGHAVAGGLELAAWCDLRVVEESAVLGVFCRKWGVPLIDGGTIRLPRLIGHSLAMDLILTGRSMHAEEALRAGLANRVVPDGQARLAAEALAKELTRNPQVTLREDRLSAYEQWNLTYSQAFQNEWKHGMKSLRSTGAAATAAFLSRQKTTAEAVSEEGSEGGKQTPGSFDAVMFDLGGVVFDSPFPAIAQYEKDLGLPKNTINMHIARCGDKGAFQQLERGELSVEEFYDAFQRETAHSGLAGIDGKAFIATLEQALKPRESMLGAIRSLKEHGLKTAAVTNNYQYHDANKNYKLSASALGVDRIIESARCGLRKPDPAIYLLACRQLSVLPNRVIFLDDIGTNLKAAKHLGMTTIKVEASDSGGLMALRMLETYLNLPLLRLAKKTKL